MTAKFSLRYIWTFVKGAVFFCSDNLKFVPPLSSDKIFTWVKIVLGSSLTEKILLLGIWVYRAGTFIMVDVVSDSTIPQRSFQNKKHVVPTQNFEWPSPS